MAYFESFFQIDLEGQANDRGEVAVRCPFPHTNELTGETYIENTPSAHINIRKRVFHCKACGAQHSEASFVRAITGMTYKEALKLLGTLEDHQDRSWIQQRKNFLNTEDPQVLVRSLGFWEASHELQIGYTGEGISFPVFFNGQLLDVRTYRPDGKPKVMSEKGAQNLLLPYDLWINDERDTVLAAGEKDMGIFREHGFNSITFTGGEQSFPTLFKYSFKGKRVFIVYDNDQAGREGALKAAYLLKEAGAIPFVVDGHYSVCTEKGEDAHDFFMKYGRSAEEMQAIFDMTDPFSEQDYQRTKDQFIPMMNLLEATQGEYSDKLVRSRVQVVATFEEVYVIPEYAELEKREVLGKGCMMYPGETVEWSLEESNAKDVLYLMDNNLNEQKIRENLQKLAGISPKEKSMIHRIKSKTNVFKAVVTDYQEKEDMSDEAKLPPEMTMYIIGQRLKGGDNLEIQYRMVPNPSQGNQVVGIVTKAESLSGSMLSFSLDEAAKESLKVFQVQPGETVQERIDIIFDHMKAFTGVSTKKSLGLTAEFFYHTVLEFKFGKKNVRGYLEPMMIGDSRTGKSEVAKSMLEMYELGVFASLKNSSVASLIGGSDKVASGGFKTKLGIIPRNHRGAVILEEFSGADPNFISSMTDIRSSNRVRIGRVNGQVNVPAMVRMLTISNTRKLSGGGTLPIKQYPHGVSIVNELIGAAEDIARYDFFVLAEQPNLETEFISPLEEIVEEPFPKDSYMNRVRFAWSRKPEHIKFVDRSDHYIVEKSMELNKEFNTHINFFGVEAWKKVARLSTAVACTVCSTPDFEHIHVTKEHVDYAVQFLRECYDNHLFRLKEYVQEQRKYSIYDDHDVVKLQGIVNNNGTLVQTLLMSTETTHRQLQASSGLKNDEYNQVMERLTGNYFLRYQGDKILPTEKLRNTYQHIQSLYVDKI